MFDYWNTKDGRRLQPNEIDNLHLLQIINNIETNKNFKDSANAKWSIVLKAEAIRRGLDYSKVPYNKTYLIDWLFEEWKKYQSVGDENAIKQFFHRKMQDAGIVGLLCPQIDVSCLDGKV